MKLIIFPIIVVVTCSDYVLGAQKILQGRPLVVLKRSYDNSKLPVAPDAKQCGGSGELTELRAQGCIVNNDVCSIPSGQYLQLEIDYVATRNAKILNLKVDCAVDDNDPEVIYDAPILNSRVNQGVKYTIQISYSLDPSLRAKRLKVKYQVHDNVEGSLRLCTEAEAVID